MNQFPHREDAVLESLLTLPAGERGTRLEEACGTDPELRCMVEAMLRAHEAVGALMASGHWSAAALPQAFEKPGDRIGRYSLLEQIGEGGCGVVYLAEQHEPVKRQVALKVIKLGMDTRQVVARFEAERQALAMMDHPNIARIFDGGVTDAGRPYFVMELVRGVKLTDYCDRERLGPRDRVELLVQVCQAVQHAHQKGVIHRDIKPSNILVTVNDKGVPVPKVIDFGIAKAVEGRLTDKTLLTGFQQFVGTPAYTSPEQAALSNLDVDTRSDIYSLGVLLYELLTGRTPFDTQEVLAAGLDALRRAICDQEPARPSNRLSALSALDLATAARLRQCDAGRLVSTIRGDLDWIVMKCLEKDRARRYETANDLALDLQRHLGNEPVVARPPTARYRLQKFVRRNRTAMAVVAVVGVILVAGIATSTSLALWANSERKQALKSRKEEATQRRRAEESESQTRERLRESYLAQAQANRFSGRPGRRFASLTALSNAAAIHPSLKLRNEAIACMALTDAHSIRRLKLDLDSALTFDSEHDRYAALASDGLIAVHDSLTDSQLITLAGPDLQPSDAAFVSGGNLLAVSYGSGATNTCQVWDLVRGQVAITLTNVVTEHLALSFDRTTWRLAVGHGDRSIGLYPIATNGTPVRFDIEQPVMQMQFQPRTNKLAICSSGRKEVKVLDLENPENTRAFTHDQPVRSIAWNPDGDLLAVGCQDGRVYLWNTTTGARQSVLEGHEREIIGVFFDQTGKFIASFGGDAVTRVWEPFSGRLSLTIPSIPAYGALGFSADNQHLLFGDLNGFSLRQFAAAEECESFDKLRSAGLKLRGKFPAWLENTAVRASPETVSPNGRYSSRLDSQDPAIVITDTANNHILKRIRIGPVPLATATFSPDGQWLIIGIMPGYMLFKVPSWESAVEIMGDPTATTTLWAVAFSPDSTLMALATSRSAPSLRVTATGQELAVFESPRKDKLIGLRFNSDGSELAGFFETEAAEVWNLRLIRKQLSAMRLDWETKAVQSQRPEK